MVFNIANESDFIDMVEHHKGIIIDFYSDQCQPCMNIMPYYKDLAKEYGYTCPSIRFCKIDVINHGELGNSP